MAKIDVTMTATIRPLIIDATLKSFCKKILKPPHEYRLIVNIDPIGEANILPKRILKICKNYFSDIVFNFPKNPSFPAAVIWTWSRTTADFVFHLEDDWLISKDLDIGHMMKILQKDKDLACLRLSKYNIPKKEIIKLFRSIYEYKPEGYYVAKDRARQMGLNPVLIKGEYVRNAFPLMVTTKNPEKQFRDTNTKMKNFVLSWRYGIYGKPGWSALVIDNGTTWRIQRGLDKGNPGKEPFLTWRKKTQEEIDARKKRKLAKLKAKKKGKK